MPVDVEEIELAPPPPATPVATPASTAPATARPGETPGALKVTPRDEYMAAFSDVEAPDFGIAPVGVDLQDARPEPEAPRVDLSQFSLAPVGSDMGEMPRAVDGPKPDISHSSWRTDRSPPQKQPPGHLQRPVGWASAHLALIGRTRSAAPCSKPTSPQSACTHGSCRCPPRRAVLPAR